MRCVLVREGKERHGLEWRSMTVAIYHKAQHQPQKAIALRTSQVYHLVFTYTSRCHTILFLQRSVNVYYTYDHHDLRPSLSELHTPLLHTTTATPRRSLSPQCTHIPICGNEHSLPSLSPSNLPPNPQCTASSIPPPPNAPSPYVKTYTTTPPLHTQSNISI